MKSEIKNTYDFVSINFKKDERLKDMILDLFYSLIPSEEHKKFEFSLKEDTLRDKEVRQLLIYLKKDLLNKEIIPIIDFCKHIIHLKGVKTLVARIKTDDNFYLVSGGDSWSKEARHVLATFDKIKIFYKEIVNGAPFYIIKKDKIVAPLNSKLANEAEFDAKLKSSISSEDIGVRIRTYEYSNKRISIVETTGIYVLTGISFMTKTGNMEKVIGTLKKRLNERGYVLYSIRKSEMMVTILGTIVSAKGWDNFEVEIFDHDPENKENKKIVRCSVDYDKPPQLDIGKLGTGVPPIGRKCFIGFYPNEKKYILQKIFN